MGQESSDFLCASRWPEELKVRVFTGGERALPVKFVCRRGRSRDMQHHVAIHVAVLRLMI